MINKLGSLDVWESRPSNSGRRNVLLAISKMTLDWQNRTTERTNQPIPSSTHQPQKDPHYTPAPSARLNAQLTLALSFLELSLNQMLKNHYFQPIILYSYFWNLHCCKRITKAPLSPKLRDSLQMSVTVQNTTRLNKMYRKDTWYSCKCKFKTMAIHPHFKSDLLK